MISNVVLKYWPILFYQVLILVMIIMVESPSLVLAYETKLMSMLLGAWTLVPLEYAGRGRGL